MSWKLRRGISYSTLYFARYICALDEHQSLQSNYDDGIYQTNSFSTDSFKDKTVKQIRDKNLAEEAEAAKRAETQKDNSITPPGNVAASLANDAVLFKKSILDLSKV